MSSLFTFNNDPTSNYQPAHVPAFQDTFELAGDDSDDDDDVPLGGRGGSSSYNHHSAVSSPAHSSGAAASTLSTPPPPPVASSSSSSSPSLPGGYDFEPQSDPAPLLPTTNASSGGPPSIPSSTRPSLSSASSPFASRRPRAPSAAAATAADETDNEADLYGRQNAGGGGGLLGWGRGLVGRLRGHQSTSSGGGAAVGGAESHGLLFSQDDSDETDAEGGGAGRGSSYPPRQGHRNIHLPLPARPPSFAPPSSTSLPSSSSTASPALPTGRVFGSGSSNDGVFANLSAKPDHPTNLDVVGEGPDKDEVLPTYDDANRDSTPPYWETTVITPGMSGFLEDEVIFDGLPVGNFFSFVWNLTVSMSFQFVGFLLTYLLHTTHAAKNGSRAGLGITLIQLGFYLKQRTDGFDPSAPGDSTGLNGAAGPSSSSWSWWDDTSSSSPPDSASPTLSALGALPTQVGAALSGALEASDPSASATQGLPSLMGQDALSEEEVLEMSAQANEWMAFLMVTVGSFLLIGGCLSYWRAVRWARAIRRGQGPGADAEAAYTQ